MVKITKTVHIKASVQKVYEYLIEPRNLPEYWPNLVEVTNIEPLPNGGYRDKWIYKMGFFKFSGGGETTDCKPNEFIEDKIFGGIDSYQKWTFSDENGKTKATFEVEYTIPIPLVGPIIEKAMQKINHRDGDRVMRRLKAILEQRRIVSI